jgi:uncharacterized protein YbjT (DUF2867 family)
MVDTEKQESKSDKKTIAVAGASGFIGSALEPVLEPKYDLLGLSRRRKSQSSKGYSWRQCNLFSRSETYKATEGADIGLYLVHSMQPKSSLTQAHFRDLDLLCADNFARAAKRRNFDHVVYVSGIIPETDEPLSTHLTSRLEVEKTLGAYGTPVTTLRAGLIVGDGGSSTEILVRLVNRLPIMGLPSWTRTKCSPIDIDDMSELIVEVLEKDEFKDDNYDVGGPKNLTYEEMLMITADALDKERLSIPLPFVTPKISTLWVSLFSSYSSRLVRPLVESLRHDMIPKDQRLQKRLGQEPIPFEESIRKAVRPAESESTKQLETSAGDRSTSDNADTLTKTTSKEVAINSSPDSEAKKVRSVQRLTRPEGRTAQWVAREYANWLPDFMWPVIDVRRDEKDDLSFYLNPFPWPLLLLDFDTEVSNPDRQLFWIRGGVLAKPSEWGRLEFREVLNGEYVIAAIHDFEPRLPWLIYRFTQALIHLFVMWGFENHLVSIDGEKIAELEEVPSESPRNEENTNQPISEDV